MNLKLPLALLGSSILGCVSPKRPPLNKFLHDEGGNKTMYAISAEEVSKFLPASDKSNLFDTIILYGKYTEKKREVLMKVEQIYHSQIGPMETAIYHRYSKRLEEIDCGPECSHEFANKYNREFKKSKLWELK